MRASGRSWRTRWAIAWTRRVLPVLDQRRQKVVLDPLAHELVARTQAQDAVGHAVELHAREPLVEARGRLVPREGDGVVPGSVALHSRARDGRVAGLHVHL